MTTTVEAVRVLLRALIEKTGARISYSALPTVQADGLLLQQLFQNLISNAIKYHRPGHPPVIGIEGDRCKEGWRFAVTDNGQGIPREHQGVIFEPLKRLHGNEIPGSGLGLALCRTGLSSNGTAAASGWNRTATEAALHFASYSQVLPRIRGTASLLRITKQFPEDHPQLEEVVKARRLSKVAAGAQPRCLGFVRRRI